MSSFLARSSWLSGEPRPGWGQHKTLARVREQARSGVFILLFAAGHLHGLGLDPVSLEGEPAQRRLAVVSTSEPRRRPRAVPLALGRARVRSGASRVVCEVGRGAAGPPTREEAVVERGHGRQSANASDNTISVRKAWLQGLGEAPWEAGLRGGLHPGRPAPVRLGGSPGPRTRAVRRESSVAEGHPRGERVTGCKEV